MWMVFMAIGFISGIIITLIIIRTFFSCGNLRIDLSDPEDGPYLFLELTKELNAVLNKKIVIFTVRIKNDLPHK